MDRLAAMQTLVKVVECGSFAAAARQLDQSRAAVSKQISQLEAHLGGRLLHRTTRRVTLTELGRAYHDRCLAILTELAAAEELVTRQSAAPRGRLRVNAPLSFGVLRLGPAISDFLQGYPDVQIALDLTDRFVDPVEEGYDLLVRIGQLQDSRLVARRIAPVPRLLCAAPAYLARHGQPASVDDLSGHRCLQYTHLPHGEPWQLAGPQGERTITVAGPLCVNNGDVLRQAALDGLGIALLPAFIVAADLEAGRLVPVLPGVRPRALALYGLYPSHRHLSPKVRVFVDFLVERFG